MACVAAGAADALRDGVEVCGLARGWSEMAGLACLLALAPEQALGLQFARAAPVNGGPAVRLAGVAHSAGISFLRVDYLNRGTWLGRKYVAVAWPEVCGGMWLGRTGATARRVCACVQLGCWLLQYHPRCFPRV